MTVVLRLARDSVYLMSWEDVSARQLKIGQRDFTGILESKISLFSPKERSRKT
jgi:hypothetical protein